MTALGACLRDAAERPVLPLGMLRERGHIFRAPAAAGCPPVLVCSCEVMMGGANLARP